MEIRGIYLKFECLLKTAYFFKCLHNKKIVNDVPSQFVNYVSLDKFAAKPLGKSSVFRSSAFISIFLFS